MFIKLTLFPTTAKDAVDEFDTLVSILFCKTELEVFNSVMLDLVSILV